MARRVGSAVLHCTRHSVEEKAAHIHTAAGAGEVVDIHNHRAAGGTRSPEEGMGSADIAAAVEEGRSRLGIQTVLGSPTSFTLVC